jgi:PKD repeat protein
MKKLLLVSVVAAMLSASPALAATTASYTYASAAPVINQPVTFDGRASTCQYLPCTYTWEDVGPSGRDSYQLGTGRTLVFTFRNPGKKYVRLTVRDNRGPSSSTAKTITVSSAPPLPPGPPTAAFTFSPASPTTAQAVAFDGTTSTCPASPCTYTWQEVGADGTGSTALGTGQSLSYTFTTAATEYVRLTVRDAQDRTDATTKTVVVTDPPVDTDGDGVPDSIDQCPADPGRASNNGCPVVPPPPGSFPTPSTTGVPAGWAPAQTRSGDLVVTQAGAVVQDVLLQNADLIVDAPNVTIRRVKLQGGRIFNTQGSCQNGMVVEDSTLEPPPGQSYIADSEGVVGNGGYTARRVKIWRRAEGFRVGGKSDGCGPVRIEDSFEKIVIPPGRCDLHSDGIQGFDGPALTVVNTTIDFNEAGCGTAPFFVPDGQGNTSATVDRLLVMGGGATFRLGVPATVTGLKIVDRSWFYAPLDVKCSLATAWDASIVTITPDYQVATTVRPQSCNTETGS